jgi:hypothetical protein
MSVVKVNQITNFNNDGPVEFSRGLIIPAAAGISGGLNANVGVCTASFFSGDGSGLTITNGIGKNIATVIPFLYL